MYCVCVYIYIYFKNTGYLLVKTALLFSLENFPKLCRFKGSPRLPAPFVSPRHLGTLALATSQGTSLNVLSRILARHSIFALVFFTSLFPFITIFSLLTFTQIPLTVLQTFCTSAGLFRVCKVRLRYERWIQQQSRRHQIWPLPNQNKGNFGSVLTAHHVCLRFYMIIIPYALSAEIRYVI